MLKHLLCWLADCFASLGTVPRHDGDTAFLSSPWDRHTPEQYLDMYRLGGLGKQ